jgi:hypothetical protein
MTSTYLLDLDLRRLKRIPGTVDVVIDDHGLGWQRSALPDDDRWCDLILLIECRVGAPLIAIDGTERGAGPRISTLVKAIAPTAVTRHDPPPRPGEAAEPRTAHRQGHRSWTPRRCSWPPGSSTTSTARRSAAPDSSNAAGSTRGACCKTASGSTSAVAAVRSRT